MNIREAVRQLAQEYLDFEEGFFCFTVARDHTVGEFLFAVEAEFQFDISESDVNRLLRDFVWSGRSDVRLDEIVDRVSTLIPDRRVAVAS